MLKKYTENTLFQNLEELPRSARVNVHILIWRILYVFDISETKNCYINIKRIISFEIAEISQGIFAKRKRSKERNSINSPTIYMANSLKISKYSSLECTYKY